MWSGVVLYKLTVPVLNIEDGSRKFSRNISKFIQNQIAPRSTLLYGLRRKNLTRNLKYDLKISPPPLQNSKANEL